VEAAFDPYWYALKNIFIPLLYRGIDLLCGVIFFVMLFMIVEHFEL